VESVFRKQVYCLAVSLGANGLRRLTLLLPGSGSTHLSDNTVAAVLCTIQEVITRDIENAK
jgi:hypothetical protein